MKMGVDLTNVIRFALDFKSWAYWQLLPPEIIE